MDENQKPFACNIDGCEMTFTNEDHLNWHHKKHDMVLNLGLANKNAEVADQTPTPTRFIRNCEEVGLFQDLQNVNPFDETFKKAVEASKSGTLHLPNTPAADDTLHTPHIFPHVENANPKHVDMTSDNHSTQSGDFCIDSVQSMHENNVQTESFDLTGDAGVSEAESTTNKHSDLKNRLKETIKNKGKAPLMITPVPLEKLIKTRTEPTTKRLKIADDYGYKRQKIDNTIGDEKAKIREMNRAAQFRSRKKKQIQWKNMQEELDALKNDNTKLFQENLNYKHKFTALMELVAKHKDNGRGGNASLLDHIEEILKSAAPIPKKTVAVKKQKAIAPVTPPLIPVSLFQPPHPLQTVQNPVLIQVVGSVAQLAVSVLPNK